MSTKMINILTLDGGGVRGLSALLILDDLIRRVAILLNVETIDPGDVFQIVAGTSTGGLIAIMLGKLHMSVPQCIQQYRAMATELFGKKSFRGWISGGHWKERYSEETFLRCFRKVATQYRGDDSIRMLSDEGHSDILTTVVARELLADGSFKLKPVFICSHGCDPQLNFLARDAARATAAAPTYFPIAHLGNPQRFFIDGAFSYNNPSFEVYDHYTDPTVKVPWDTARLRVINIGTGSAPETGTSSLPRRLGRRARKRLTGVRNMFKAAKRSIVDAELAFFHLKTVARKNSNLDVHRFSSRNDVYRMKLDAHKKLDEIGLLTKQYLDDPDVCAELDEVAQALAKDFRARKQAVTRPVSEPSDEIVLEDAQVPRRRSSKDLDRLTTQGLNVVTPRTDEPLSGSTTVPTDEPPEKPNTADGTEPTDILIKTVSSALHQDTSSLAGLCTT